MQQAIKKRIPIMLVNLMLLLGFAACLLIASSIMSSLRSQQAATTWAGQSGERFAQLSAFLPKETSFDESSIRSFRQSVDKAMIDASIDSSGGRVLHSDAWSAQGDVSIVSERGAASARAFGVGGNFFLFHPLILRDGSYLSPNDLMKDRIVLDEEMAWRLFGSVYLQGLEVTIGNKPFLIAGVIARENDIASRKAYTDGAGLFMSYEALQDLTGGSSSIVCYEIVMPDPITGFALKTMTDSFPDTQAVIVENSIRFSLSGILDVYSSFGTRSMKTDGIIFPYWENAARYAEDWISFLWALSLVLVIFPCVSAIAYFVKFIRFSVRQGLSMAGKKIEQRDEHLAEKYMQMQMDMEEVIIPDIDEIIREILDEQEKPDGEHNV